MTIFPPYIAISFTFILFLFPSRTHAFGSVATIGIISNTDTVCGIREGLNLQSVVCYHDRLHKTISMTPNVSFEVISGGNQFLCGLNSGRTSMTCWNFTSPMPNFTHKLTYTSGEVILKDVTVGVDHVCVLANSTGDARCWGLTTRSFPSPPRDQIFLSITSGEGFSCGILRINRKVQCWGTNTNSASDLEFQFRDFSMYNLVAGSSHACGYNMDGLLICKGRNDTGQLGIIHDKSTPFEYSVLALGIIHSCGIRLQDQKVVCWGGKGEFSSDLVKDISFETIVAGTGFTCGVATNGFSLICWGPSWNMWNKGVVYVPDFPKVVPSPCVQDKCPCNYYPGCANYCNSGCMCMRCCPSCSRDAARHYNTSVSSGKVARSALLPS